MRHVDTEARRTRQKREAVTGVLLFALIQAACTAVFAALCLIPDLPGWLFCLFIAMAALCLVPLFFAIGVLRQRFKEIEGGELDEAGQY